MPDNFNDYFFGGQNGTGAGAGGGSFPIDPRLKAKYDELQSQLSGGQPDEFGSWDVPKRNQWVADQNAARRESSDLMVQMRQLSQGIQPTMLPGGISNDPNSVSWKEGDPRWGDKTTGQGNPKAFQDYMKWNDVMRSAREKNSTNQTPWEQPSFKDWVDGPGKQYKDDFKDYDWGADVQLAPDGGSPYIKQTQQQQTAPTGFRDYWNARNPDRQQPAPQLTSGMSGQQPGPSMKSIQAMAPAMGGTSSPPVQAMQGGAPAAGGDAPASSPGVWNEPGNPTNTEWPTAAGGEPPKSPFDPGLGVSEYTSRERAQQRIDAGGDTRTQWQKDQAARQRQVEQGATAYRQANVAELGKINSAKAQERIAALPPKVPVNKWDAMRAGGYAHFGGGVGSAGNPLPPEPVEPVEPVDNGYDDWLAAGSPTGSPGNPLADPQLPSMDPNQSSPPTPFAPAQPPKTQQKSNWPYT